MMCERAVSRTTQGELLGQQADGAGDDRRLVDRDRAVPAAGACARRGASTSTRTTSGCARTSRRSRRRCRRCSTTSPRGRCRSTARSASSDEMPFSAMVIESFHMGLADGPTEVHKVTRRPPGPQRVPAGRRACSRPATSRRCRDAALARYADVIERDGRAAVTADARRAETAPVRPGEELDWAALEAYLRGHLPELAGDSTAAAVPERLGQPHLPAALRRHRAGAAPAAVRRRRAGRPRHEARVPRAVEAVADLRPGAAGVPVLRRPRRDRLRLRRDGAARRRGRPRRRAGVDGPTTPTSAAASASPSSTRWPSCTCSTRPPPTWRRSAGPTASSSARCRLADALGPRAARRRPAGDGRRCPAGWRRRMPAPTRVSFVHNDLKLDNCQFDPADPDRVQSIFDWDMTTLGEPLVDLGTLLNYWPDPTDPPDAGRVSHQGLLAMGLPTRAEIVEPLRRAHRHRRVGRGLVRGVRPVEDRRRHPAAAPPLGRAARAPTRGWRRSPTGSRCSPQRRSRPCSTTSPEGSRSGHRSPERPMSGRGRRRRQVIGDRARRAGR